MPGSKCGGFTIQPSIGLPSNEYLKSSTAPISRSARNDSFAAEAKKIADLADTYLIPTSPHTCGGPLLYCCATHLSTAVPNFLIMESNYWKYAHQFPHFINNVPTPKEGHITASELPGIGAESGRSFSRTAMRSWRP